MPATIPVERILASYVVDSAGCHVWSGALDRNGYGRVDFKTVRYRAHRFFYERLVGPIPAGLQLDHLCRNRRCVNPDHLQPVTQAENVRRGTSPTAVNWAKTHCASGHEFTPGNTRVHPKWGRACRACNRAAVEKYQSRSGRTSSRAANTEFAR